MRLFYQHSLTHLEGNTKQHKSASYLCHESLARSDESFDQLSQFFQQFGGAQALKREFECGELKGTFTWLICLFTS